MGKIDIPFKNDAKNGLAIHNTPDENNQPNIAPTTPYETPSRIKGHLTYHLSAPISLIISISDFLWDIFTPIIIIMIKIETKDRTIINPNPILLRAFVHEVKTETTSF